MPTMRTGTRATAGTGAILQGRRKIDVSDRIALLDPNKAPLVVMLSMMGKKSCHNPKFEWIEDELDPRVDAVNYSTGYTAGDVSIIVDHGSYFRANDIVKHVSSGEVMRVTAVSSNTLTVSRSVGATAAASLSDNDTLLIIGNSNAEGTTSRTLKSTLEVMKTNYTQIFRTPFGVTNTMRQSDLYAEQDLPYQARKKGIEHAIDIERAFFFGEKSEVTSSQQAERTTGGLIEFISTNVTAVGGTLTQSTFDAALEPIFRYGSQRKVAFLAPRLFQDIHDWFSGKLEVTQREDFYGVRLKRYESPFGTIFMHNHWLLRETTTYQGYGFIVDLDNLKYRFLRGRDTHINNNIQENDADETKNEYLTECGLECQLEKTHGKLTGVTAS